MSTMGDLPQPQNETSLEFYRTFIRPIGMGITVEGDETVPTFSNENEEREYYEKRYGKDLYNKFITNLDKRFDEKYGSGNTPNVEPIMSTNSARKVGDEPTPQAQSQWSLNNLYEDYMTPQVRCYIKYVGIGVGTLTAIYLSGRYMKSKVNKIH